MNWDDLRFFTALARYGSLSATARALDVNHATVARRISALEQELGEALVERRQDGYVLTAQGQQVLDIASRMETEAGRLTRASTPQQPAGLVRINTTPGLAQAYLLSRLATLTTRYPALDIELATDMRVVSLERHEADIALRLGTPLDGHIIARSLVGIGSGFYATAPWLAQLAANHEPVFIGFDEANSELPEARWLARYFPRARLAIRADNHSSQLIAARAGAGIALLPHFLARPCPDLQRCTLQPLPPERPLWLLTRRLSPADSHIRVVTEFLQQQFEQDRALFTDKE